MWPPVPTSPSRSAGLGEKHPEGSCAKLRMFRVGGKSGRNPSEVFFVLAEVTRERGERDIEMEILWC